MRHIEFKRGSHDNRKLFSLLSLRVKVFLSFFIIIMMLSLVNIVTFFVMRYSMTSINTMIEVNLKANDIITLTGTPTVGLPKEVEYFTLYPEDEENKKKIVSTFMEIKKNIEDLKSMVKDDKGIESLLLLQNLFDTYQEIYIDIEDQMKRKAVFSDVIENISKFRDTSTFMYDAFKDFMSIELTGYGIIKDNQTKLLNNMAVSILILIVLFAFAGLITSLLLSNSITRPIEQLVTRSKTISKGDLTVKFEDLKRKDEIGNLVRSFASMVDTLKDIIQKIYIAIIILTRNLKTVFQSSNAVKDSANVQAVTVEETHSNFESMNKMVETISNESNKANLYSEQALNRAKIGMESIHKLETEMGKIESSSVEITNIIEMINDIAENTNLLSLNASIESARAGEAGKGFNIVAGEIRKLAEKSTNAANRIHELITNNNRIIQDGVTYAKNTTAELKEIATSNELIAGLVKTITSEIYKVKLSSQEILQAINHISNIAQANLTESEKVFAAMGNFVNQTLELQQFVGQFDIRSEEIKENQQHLEEILNSKLNEAQKVLNEFGQSPIPTGNIVKIGEYKVLEYQIGNTVLTGMSEIVDAISTRTHTSVTVFQPYENRLVSVASTVINFDNSRAIGSVVTSDNIAYKTVMDRKNYFGRTFVVNKWYMAVYMPIIVGDIIAVLYLGISEDTEYAVEKRDFTADKK
jgi:methyl-accepting chemotaxis protein